MSEIRHITENEFEDVINENKLVLIDFYAQWCPPCKMLSPVLDDVMEEMNGKIEMVKINVDENEKISRQFQIISIPTMIIFKDGEPVSKVVGFRNYEDVVSEIEKWL